MAPKKIPPRVGVGPCEYPRVDSCPLSAVMILSKSPTEPDRRLCAGHAIDYGDDPWLGTYKKGTKI